MNERFKERKWKKGFTLIELIVVMAVIAVLVLLAAPRFLGKTKEADKTKHVANAKTLEDAAERYYIDEQDWPRLTDDAYTSDEIESYSERVLDVTGEEIELDPEGSYYDIDYEALSKYVKVPDSSDKNNYILRNPVGKIYYMENLNEVGIARVNYSNAKDGLMNPKDGLMNPIEPREPIAGEIVIDSAEELAKIGKPGYPLDGDYILTSNINLSGYSKEEGWTPIGNNYSRFIGSFNGNGYNITGLTIDKPSQINVGLFGYTEGATIRNVALEDINVTGTSRTGGLVGYAYRSTVSNSYATGSVKGTGDVGGLVGWANESTTITNSYATGPVEGTLSVGGLVGSATKSTISNSYATGEVTGTERVGGLAGWATRSTSIRNSYATGEVTGTSGVGGLVGWAWSNIISPSTISNSYATGLVKGLDDVGGFVGQVDSTVTINNSYWDTKTTGQEKSAGGVGRTTEGMKKQTTYSNWNFDDVWKIDEGNDYPKLR